MSRTKPKPKSGRQYPLRFGSGFLDDHARLIISDPKIAIIELVANAWDAGANQVEITWPSPAPDIIAVRDNGTGMTHDEFLVRWNELNYSRIKEQGDKVIFPDGNEGTLRHAFGRNGKGRHSMFCFNNKYFVKTWCNGEGNVFSVERSSGETPFRIEHVRQFSQEGHGTEVSAELVRHELKPQVVRDLIGSKFIADPAFRISVNSEPVVLTDLQHLIEKHEFEIEGIGTIVVRVVDSQKTGRTSKQHGIAWWVNGRLVGEPSWKGFDDESFLDARSAEAKRYTFIVEADYLVDYVTEDWSGFKSSDVVSQVQSAVRGYILKMLRILMVDVHKARKLTALRENKTHLNGLSNSSLNYIGKALDEVQKKYPSFGERELVATTEVIASMEKSRSGFSLLEKLAVLSPDDLDQLNEILAEWTVQEAQIVLGELEKRLKLIKNLERLVEDPSANELHDLQPLFERGLWIFGPEYESMEFTSNRTLTTVIQQLFKDSPRIPLTNPRNRPDFVILPDSTLGIYSVDSFDRKSGEPNGIEKVLIVELKRGGFMITHTEVSQAENYIYELRKGQRVQKSTQINAFVLGATLAEDAEEKTLGENQHSIISPRTYSVVLRMAHARTFNLLKAIKSVKKEPLSDVEIGEILGMPT